MIGPAEIRRALSDALETMAREVARAGDDTVEFLRALEPALREAADFYARTLDAWDAAGGDPELAAVVAGSTLFTPEQTRRWLAGERLRDIVGEGPPEVGGPVP